MKSLTLSLWLTLILLIGGCDRPHDQAPSEQTSVQGEDDTSGQLSPTVNYRPASCEPVDTKPFVHRVMRDTYFWSDTVPENVRYDDFETPEQLVEFLKFKEKDRFTFLTSKQQGQAFRDGQQLGLGLNKRFDASGSLRISSILANSSAAEAGIERGDTILAVGGKTIDEIIQKTKNQTHATKNQVQLYLEQAPIIVGPVGNKANLTIKKHNEPKDKKPIHIILTKTVFTPPTVSKTEVMEIDGQKIGYLVLNLFAVTSKAELNRSFATFKNKSISELIIDLRYNHGGSILPALQLGSLIWGYNSGTEEFARVYFNEKYASSNSPHPFLLLENRINLSRVFILTGKDTLSASELVINSLKPYMQVVQIGGTTGGKPYAMTIVPFCNKVLAPITFEIKNALDQGEYYNGIEPDCAVNDDLNHKLGDKTEGLLNEALYFIASGRCNQSNPVSQPTPSPRPGLTEEMKARLRSLNGPEGFL
jgi:C-terminal processing protease CtpA/Prc